ncbi:MAG: hypothetical protein V4607_12630 [Pseudomonadota bacterium]
MNRFSHHSAQILRKLGSTTVLLFCMLSPLALPVYADDAKPTAAEITKARAECAMHKQKVRAIENANADDAQLPAMRLAWAQACGRAQDLITAASGTPPAKPQADPNAATP